MAENKKDGTETKEEATPDVTFLCQRCNKPWSIHKMRRITRFRPVLIVCPECEKELR